MFAFLGVVGAWAMPRSVSGTYRTRSDKLRTKQQFVNCLGFDII